MKCGGCPESFSVISFISEISNIKVGDTACSPISVRSDVRPFSTSRKGLEGAFVGGEFSSI